MNQRIAIIGKEILYFRKLVEDLLFLSGIVSGGDEKKNIDFNISNILLDVAEIVEEQGVDIDVNCDDAMTHFGDHFLFRRMIRNLLDNSAKYATSEIQVSAQKIGPNLEVVVRDDGEGFSEEVLNSFGKKRTSRSVEGSDSVDISLGLGSVIIRKIIERFNGSIELSNQNSGGACVKITLPEDSNPVSQIESA